MITYKTEGNRVMVTVNLKEYLYQVVSVPLKDVRYRVEGDYIVVEAEIDTEKLLSKVG